MRRHARNRARSCSQCCLPNVTQPGDTYASDRYYAEDNTEPFVLHPDRLEVPRGLGLGVTPIPEILDELTTSLSTERPTRPLSQGVAAQ